MNIEDAHKNVEKYFKSHKEYTHLILVSDDGQPKFEHIAMLIADLEKYDFPCIAGTSSIDSLSDDLFLSVTFNEVVKEVTYVSRKSYECLPYEFTELKGLVKVWFEGNALLTLRRDVFNKVGLIHPKIHGVRRVIDWSVAGDLANSYYIAKAGFSIYADLRIFMHHYRYPRTTVPYNILIMDKAPAIIEEKATAEVPKAEPAPLIENIPEKYQRLMDYYYGKPKTVKICIVTEFTQEKFFQWTIALNKFSNTQFRYGGWFEISKEKGHNIILSSVEINPATMQVYPDNHSYWNPIREADIVFVYCARQDMKWEWYKAPVIVKKWMKPEAKMVCQFDCELMWLWNPAHSWWEEKYYPSLDGKTPEEFLKENKILEVADAYFTVLDNEPKLFNTVEKFIYVMIDLLLKYGEDNKCLMEEMIVLKETFNRELLYQKKIEKKNGEDLNLIQNFINNILSQKETIINKIKKNEENMQEISMQNKEQTQKLEKINQSQVQNLKKEEELNYEINLLNLKVENVNDVELLMNEFLRYIILMDEKNGNKVELQLLQKWIGKNFNSFVPIAIKLFTQINNYGAPWAKYTSKPVYYMPLPQLVRYSNNIVIPQIKTTRGTQKIWDSELKGLPEGNKLDYIATIHHSIKSSTAKNTLNNVLSKLNFPVMYFSSRFPNKDNLTINDLPYHSQFLEKGIREGYLFSLRKAKVAIDDNEGYIGWSRFAMECALSCIPCVGSTKAVKQLFPDLYTEHNDYVKQTQLLNQLLNDNNFYQLNKACGWIRAVQGLSTANLVTKFLKITMWDLNE